MAFYKVVVVRNSDNKVVYENSGNESVESKLDRDAAQFDSKTHTITKTDIESQMAAIEKSKRDRKNRIKNADLSSANNLASVKTILKDLLDELKELRGL